jgi:hypothetical protein
MSTFQARNAARSLERAQEHRQAMEDYAAGVRRETARG